MNKFVLINDDLIPESRASLFINDLSIQRGYGIFDYFKTVNGKAAFLDDHLDRFYRSASEMHLPAEKDRKALTELLDQLMLKNNIPDSGVRITLTGGYSPDGCNPARPNLIITQSPFSVDQHAVTKGIGLVTFSHQRQLPQVKTLDYLMAIRLQPFIHDNQADDVLYYQNRLITECPRANFFIINQEGRVQTSTSNLLNGVIRKQVLEMAGEHFETLEKDISLDDLAAAQEAFVTSTTKNILPIVKINNRTIGNGRPGKITMKLSDELNYRISILSAPLKSQY